MGWVDGGAPEMMFILLWGLILPGDGQRREVEAAEGAESRDEENTQTSGRWAAGLGRWGTLSGHK